VLHEGREHEHYDRLHDGLQRWHAQAVYVRCTSLLELVEQVLPPCSGRSGR
jgi:hypothetical protein